MYSDVFGGVTIFEGCWFIKCLGNETFFQKIRKLIRYVLNTILRQKSSSLAEKQRFCTSLA